MTIRRYGLAALAGLLTAGGIWLPAPLPAVAAESYFCIELVLSRNWPAARFYCDATAARDNTGTILAEGIAYFFSAVNPEDVSHAARLWRDIPPLSDNSEWRNVSGVFDQEIDTIARNAATFDRLAQYQLGVLHETGHLSAPDPAAAIFRYQQAANAGVPEAHIALARLHQQGIGVEADPVTAEQHLMAAIEAMPARARPEPEQTDVEEEVAPSDTEEAPTADVSPALDSDDDTAVDSIIEAIAVADAGTLGSAPLEETFVVGGSAPEQDLDETVPDELAQSEDTLAEDNVAEDNVADDNVPDDNVVVSANQEVGPLVANESVSADGDLTPSSNVRIITVTPQATVSLREVPGSEPAPATQPDVNVLAGVVTDVPPIEDVPLAEVDETTAPATPAVRRWDSESGVVLAPRSTLALADETVPTEAVEVDESDSLPAELDEPSEPATSPVRRWDSDAGVVLAPRSTPALADDSIPTEAVEGDGSDSLALSADLNAEAPLPDNELDDVGAPIDLIAEVQLPGDELIGDATSTENWAPPEEVAALYLPEETTASSSSDLEQEFNDDAGAGVAVTDEPVLSVSTGRLDTIDPVDRSALSCADADAGATMAMPVIREDGDQSDAPSGDGQLAGTRLEADDFAVIERGIRAKTAGDIDGALQAWQPLADAGVPTAQYLVGLLYLTGDAVPRNLRLAYAWFSLAAANGHQLANCERYRLSQRLSADDIALADDLAADFGGTP